MARRETIYRGFDDLASALRRVHAEAPHAEIALFGSKLLPGQEELGFRFTNLGVIADHAELHQQYDRSHIFVDSSHFQGFGLPALEAMACKVACVLTNVGGVQEYARHGENALMIPPHDPQACSEAILRFVHDGQLRARLGQEGRKTVERMSPNEEAKAWIRFLGEICPAFRAALHETPRQGAAA